ncbi:hypothetical protein ACMA1I_02825 [Pontibacter sp. 13R65]|uniref:hypothetical protein n=1 Tax=Pontibacter sp. 13R65 TaxID=3127458 RepID=UPI00301D99DC
MNFTALFFCFYLCWMACLPCTDKVLDHSEHHPNLADVSDSTGHSPFHEDSCPIFCSCGCCATYTVTVEPEQFVFKLYFKPKSKAITYPSERQLTCYYSFWRPPRPLV